MKTTQSDDSASTDLAEAMTVCQIAISSIDLGSSHTWYRKNFDLEVVGERRHREGEVFARVPGLPEAEFDVWCLVDEQEFFQLEIFEFMRPKMKRAPPNRNPSDIGYSTIGIHVSDFDIALERLSCNGCSPLTSPIGHSGFRRVCIRDPDGIFVEVMEDDVGPSIQSSRTGRQGLASSIKSISLSVPDLEQAYRFWAETMSLRQYPEARLHVEEHERLWELEGGISERLVLWSNGFAIELVQYDKPKGSPRPPGYLLSDQGILNVAFGTTSESAFMSRYERAISAGYRANTVPWTLPGIATVVYMIDGNGFSVELLHVEKDALPRMGFREA